MEEREQTKMDFSPQADPGPTQQPEEDPIRLLQNIHAALEKQNRKITFLTVVIFFLPLLLYITVFLLQFVPA